MIFAVSALSTALTYSTPSSTYILFGNDVSLHECAYVFSKTATKMKTKLKMDLDETIDYFTFFNFFLIKKNIF